MRPLYLVDKSAWVCADKNADAAKILRRLLEQDRVATCGQVAFELLYSARNRAEYERIATDLSALVYLETTEAVVQRGLEVQYALTAVGQHRLPPADLIIAATAELGGATVLHYDSDYDLIAAITRQRTAWIAPRGSI